MSPLDEPRKKGPAREGKDTPKPTPEKTPEDLDPELFETVIPIKADGKSTPEFSERKFTHPSAPGKEFSAEDVRRLQELGKEKRRLAEEKKSPKKKDRTPREDRGGKIFEAKDDAKGDEEPSPKKEQDWTIYPERYIGIEVKSLPQIISNEAHAQLFGELLNVLVPDAGNLLARAQESNISDEERKIVTFAQYEFAKGLKQAEMAQEKLSQGDVELIMKRDERFHEMATLIGPAQMLDVLKDQIPHMAMRNRDSVEELLGAYAALSDQRRTLRYRRWDAKVKKFLDKNKISQHDFAVFDTEVGRKTMKNKLAKQYENEAGDFVRALNWVQSVGGLRRSGFEIRADAVIKKAKNLNKPAAPLTTSWVPNFLQRMYRGPSGAVLREADRHLGSIATVLSRTVNISDAELEIRMKQIEAMPEGISKRELERDVVSAAQFKRKLTIEAFTLEKVVDVQTAGPKTDAQLKESKQVYSEKMTPERMQQAFDKDKMLYKTPDGKGWETMTSPERQHYRDSVWQPADVKNAQQHQTGRGFWASILRAFLDSFIVARKKEVSIA